MRFTQDSNLHGYTIQAIAEEGITVHTPEEGTKLLTSSFIISAERLITDWSPCRPEELQAEHLAAIIALNPEVVLLGTGQRLSFPPPALLHPLMEAGIGYEVMDSGAASRTYNVLHSEGRRVVAALLLP